MPPPSMRLPEGDELLGMTGYGPEDGRCAAAAQSAALHLLNKIPLIITQMSGVYTCTGSDTQLLMHCWLWVKAVLP